MFEHLKLSERALAHNQQCKCAKMSEIYADQSFNCRSMITAADIVELQTDISKNGLLQAVLVRNLWPNIPVEKEALAKGKKYFLMGGFRRYTAMCALAAEEIPITVINVNSEFECHDINAKENILRKDLSLWEEARGVRHYYAASMREEDVARELSVSRGWVQVRFILLRMPVEVQQAAHQGYLLQADIRELDKYTGTEQLTIAGRIADERKKGLTGEIKHLYKKTDKPLSRKKRSPEEIFKVMNELYGICKNIDPELMIRAGDLISNQGRFLPVHKILAWTCGEITSLDMHTELQFFARKFGSDYVIPSFQESYI